MATQVNRWPSPHSGAVDRFLAKSPHEAIPGGNGGGVVGLGGVAVLLCGGGAGVAGLGAGFTARRHRRLRFRESPRRCWISSLPATARPDRAIRSDHHARNSHRRADTDSRCRRVFAESGVPQADWYRRHRQTPPRPDPQTGRPDGGVRQDARRRALLGLTTHDVSDRRQLTNHDEIRKRRAVQRTRSSGSPTPRAR